VDSDLNDQEEVTITFEISILCSVEYDSKLCKLER
jgi:hypothetical protein